MALRAYFDETTINEMIGSEKCTFFPDIDFRKDVAPHVANIIFSGKGYLPETIFDIMDGELNELDKALTYVDELIYNLLDIYITDYVEKYPLIEITEKTIKSYKKYDGIVGILANSVDLDEYLEELDHIFRMFLVSEGNNIKITEYFPTHLLPIAEKALKDGFINLGKVLKNKFLINEANKIKLFQPKKMEHLPILPSNIVLKETEEGRVIILIKNSIFLAQHQKFLQQMIQGPSTTDIQTYIFCNCIFAEDIELLRNKCAFVPFKFYKCTFKKQFRFGCYIDSVIIFTLCHVKGALIFNNTGFGGPVRFIDSLFDINSQFWFSETGFFDEDWYVPLSFDSSISEIFSIDNCLFLGDVRFNSSLYQNATFSIKNTAFMGDFNFKNVKFGKRTSFENVLFSSKNTEKILMMKEDLYNSLINSGLKDVANSLNLISQKENKIFDYDSYKAELESDTIKSTAASKYIGKSVDWLAHKRMQDRKEIRFDSIPFLGKGKGITYPIEALDAYKNHDWKKLKELRQQYPIPKD